ncbi:hypothetical protein DYB38_005466 [Aphanomyces astaci]|uniref:Uncharacterized protein n=1 Tax=Aphanomyces astaci TaxID=112090 RepID=A0A397C4C7_APHAT|nr:hypothetical protein DYB38_005466 [Aphanomyces astaci]
MQAHGVIYMVDASDADRIQEASKHLEVAMAHPMLRGKPLLMYLAYILMIPTSSIGVYVSHICWLHSTEAEFGQKLQVASYVNTKVLQSVTKAKANGNLVDDRLEGGLRWILGRIEGDYDALGVRVANDRATTKKEASAAWQAQKERVWAYKEERERSAMLSEDSAANQAAFAPPKPVVKQSSDVPMCSTCESQPAVTKCAASKWMPVCSDCADALKKK